MTSARNHRLLLNGNRAVVFLSFICVSLFFSCSSKKRISERSPVVKGPDTIEKDTVLLGYPALDTIIWTEIDLSDEYDDVLGELSMNKKEVYTVKLLFPFETGGNKISDVNDKETKLGRMVQYYAGVRMALDELEKEGVRLDVEVLDAETGRFDDKIRACRNADIIIGPRNTDQLKVVANFGKVNEIPVVSPWKSGANISVENPYFLQLKTGLREHYYKLLEDAMANFDRENICLIGRNQPSDRNYLSLLQTMAQAIKPDAKTPLREFYVNEDSLIFGKTAFDSIFIDDDINCFILPHWSFSSDENFIYDVTRKLNAEKGLKEVYLYGMPILFESQKIKFDMYHSLNMRIVRSTYVDRSSPVVKAFRLAYFDRYRDFPIDEAFEGYDMMLFVGRSLYRYGKDFQYYLDREKSRLIQTEYDIRRVYRDPASDDFEDIDYFQNNHLYILRFQDDRFVAN